MQFAQLNPDGTYSHQITTTLGNVEWDETHFCPPGALTPDEAAHFRVVPLLETDPPEFDPITQSVMRDGAVLVDGQWHYHWRVDPLPAEAIAANQAAAALAEREEAKRQRAAAVARITVTTSSGKVFDGDEDSQNRMARAALALQATGTPATKWVLANNEETQATPAELIEALALAGAAQSAIW
jgi:hypothetical protein